MRNNLSRCFTEEVRSLPHSNTSLLPSLRLRMFKVIDPLEKTRLKRYERVITQPVVKSQDETSIKLIASPSLLRKKSEYMREIREMEEGINALKHFREMNRSRVSSHQEIGKGSKPQRYLSFFNRQAIEKEVNDQYLEENEKPKRRSHTHNGALSPEEISSVQTGKISPERNLEIRTILSNQVRGKLLEKIKGNTPVTISKFRNRNHLESTSRFPEIRGLMESDSLIRRSKYKKSLNSRRYNPYCAYLAMPLEERRSIVLNFEERQKNE